MVEPMNSTQALKLAQQAHAGQSYGEKDYCIGHITQVVSYVAREAIQQGSWDGNEEDLLVAAALHDVVEDTDLTLNDLRDRNASEAALSAIDSCTRRDGEKYMDMIARAKADRLGRIVKLADNWHNLTSSINSGEASRIKRYQKAREVLLG